MIELLSNTGFIMYSKKAAKLFGANGAILLGELCAKYQYWLDNGKLLENEGWFFCTREDIEADTGLSPFQQRDAVRILVENAVLTTKQMGMPSKTYYRLNANVLNDMMLRNLTTRREETAPHDVKKLNTTKKETKKETKNNSIFSRPDVKQVAEYCRERGNTVDPERFCDYYDANGWKVGKNPMKDWKAAVRTWEKNERGKGNGTSGGQPQYPDTERDKPKYGTVL